MLVGCGKYPELGGLIADRFGAETSFATSRESGMAQI